MAYYRRRRSFRRRFGRGGWGYPRRRRYTRGRFPRSPRAVQKRAFASGAIHSFVRYEEMENIKITGLTNFLGTHTWSLDKLPGYTEWTTAYDQYRIVKVITYFGYDHNKAGGLGGASYPSNDINPILYCVKDYDDSSALVTEDAYLQYNPCLMCKLGTSTNGRVYDLKVTTYPKNVTTVYNGPATNGYATVKPVWVDVGSPSVYYYGLKYGVFPHIDDPAAATITLGAMRIWHKVFIQFKHSR